jgi:hypothetical protein
MDRELRDYLLESFAMVTSIQNSLNDNPLFDIIFSRQMLVLSALKYRTAQMYHALADEKDLSVLDEHGFPNEFQVKRLGKMMSLSCDEYAGKVKAVKGTSYTSLRHGDIIKKSNTDKSEPCSCGEVHD